MKTFIYTSCLLLLGLLGARNSQAQVNAETRMGNGNSYWTLGLNGGFAWQDSDVRSRLGGGWGFYFGSSIYNRPNSFFSIDWRFRYMNTYTFGQNARDTRLGNNRLRDPQYFTYDPSTQPFAHNHFTAFHDLAIEFRLNFEQLRRRNNILLSLYAGGGMGIYGTWFDQLDLNGNQYDYSDAEIDYTGSDQSIARDIISLRDGYYETPSNPDPDDLFREDNLYRLTFTPSVGIEFGYWFSPHFALAVGHRTTFTLQDNFDGLQINNGGTIEGAVHHYTALMLHWRVFGNRSTVSCPEVKFELPTQNGLTYNTQDPSVFLQAYVYNVSSSQITYTVNGVAQRSFTFNSSDNMLRDNISLQRGRNTISISARNSCGTDAQTIVVNYTPRETPRDVTPVSNPPRVQITSPGRTPTDAATSVIAVRATVTYVPDRTGITFTVNGTPTGNFTYTNGTFVANNVTLLPGQNTITITGTNADGSDSRTVVVNYRRQEEPLPIVNITLPNTNPSTASSDRVRITATILNVADRNNVQFSVNGRMNNNFSFSGNSFVADNVPLQQGANSITITGINTRGRDVASATINYLPRVVEQPPIVTINDPRSNPYNTQSPTASITATILNVDGPSNVQCTINGRSYTGFSFRGNRFDIPSLALQTGANRITITGSNRVGRDSETQIINYEPIQQAPRPVVTITNPTQNPFTTSSDRVNIMATILHVNSSSDVFFTVNGRSRRDFSFSGTDFAVSNLILQAGNNTIEIRGRNAQGQDSKSVVVIYQQARQEQEPSVVITNPNQNPYNSATASVTINATILNVESRNNVTFTVNGRANNNFTFTGTSFVATGVNLNAGNNVVVISGSNSTGTARASTTLIYRQEQEPSVVITNPNQDPYNSPSASVTINATINNVDSRNNVTFTVNGRANNNFTFSGTSFVATGVSLNAGNNVIVITGSNSTGTARDNATLVYNPVQPPVVRFTDPNQTPYTVARNRYTIRATVDHVDNKSDVTFTINGRATTDFAFSNNQLTATNVVLNPGSNTFTVTGRNSSGQDSKSTVIVYREEVQPPIVTITIPNRNPTTVNTPSTNIAATITNIEDRSGITFTVNGRTSTAFNFTGTSFVANGVALNQGNNTFVISARNEGGQASQSTVIVYEVPLAEPTVVITTPSQNPYTSPSTTTTINATIRNVSSRNDVTFTVNGRANNNFTFSGTSFTATGVNLVGGNNAIVITGSNATGTARATTTIVYRQPKPPFVNITAPASNPFNTQVATVTINALIDYVGSANDVTFTVNGRSSNSFTFSGRNFTAANVALNAGSNTIQITGRNADGQHSASTTVIYTPFVPRPTVTITAPTGNPATSTLSIANIVATVTNVSDRSGIAVTINGRAVTNFLFSGTDLRVTNVVLSLGNNSIVITGTNSAGSASASQVIVYNNTRDPRGNDGSGQNQNGPGSTGGSGGIGNTGGGTTSGSGTDTRGGGTTSGSSSGTGGTDTRGNSGTGQNQTGGSSTGGSGGLDRGKTNTTTSSGGKKGKIKEKEAASGKTETETETTPSKEKTTKSKKGKM